MKTIQNRHLLIIGLLLLINYTSQGQQPPDTVNNQRLKPLLITSSVVYAGALVGLNELWYSDFEREGFHFFNDHNEWKQMDKTGHFFAGFHLSNLGYSGLKWAGQNHEKSLIHGVLFSAIVLFPIEIFDGFSSAYGASYSDIIANTAGAGFFYLQQKAWGDIKIHPKFSFRTTPYANQRPELLGNGWAEGILKDYNGQTYWLSFDLSKIIHSGFPKWLNIAVGYGATGMVSADDSTNKSLGYSPRRQYYLAIDFDFNEYSSRSKVVNLVLDLLNMIHLPAPALEFGEKLKFHSAYH